MGRSSIPSQNAAAPATRNKDRTDKEFLARLAKEFNSIPDREVPAAEAPSEQLTAAGATTIRVRPEKESLDAQNAEIVRTVRHAMSELHIS